MRKILCIMIAAALLITPTSTALAKSGNGGNQNKYQSTQQQKTEKHDVRIKEQKKSYKLKGASVIKYGKYKLPIAPITKGMGATVAFDKNTAVLTVTKETNKIVIDFKNKTVTVNGMADTKSGIFTAKNDKKMTVLIKYIANVLGVRVNVGKDEVIVVIPGLDLPTNVTVTPVGATVVSNTLNSTNLFMAASANIKAGQATGGKAELYVGSKLVATDAVIAATDTTVNFTTADETPTNAELQAAIPTGGLVTVKLYNSSNNYVISTVANPTLAVDYVAPTFTSAISAVYSVSGSSLSININGGSAVGDKVDVTRISLYDTTLAKAYQLTNTGQIGSTGSVVSANSILINLGSVDKLGLTGYGTTTVYLTIALGSLLTDAAGNTSTVLTGNQTVPVFIIQ